MEKALLFTRKFNGETYKFYMNKGVGCFGIYSEYVSVETPENCFGYTDTVLFNHGKAYTLHRYLQNWILKAITETLVKKGYSAYMQWKWHSKGGCRMKIYKVYYRTGNGNESYTFIEADSKEMIESVLHHVQGMTTELIRFEEV